MDNSTLAICISVGTFAASVVTPIVTSIINNRSHRKIVAFEFYAKHKAEVIENYLKAVGEYVFSAAIEDEIKFGANVGEIFMYLPKSKWEIAKRMNTLLKGEAFKDDAKTLYYEMCESFADLRRNGDTKNKNTDEINDSAHTDNGSGKKPKFRPFAKIYNKLFKRGGNQ